METDRFIQEFTPALAQGDAALFVGAGLSRPAGLVDWRGLLRDLADELRLDVDRESDLIAVAQYHVNTAGGRAALDRAIMREFTRDAHPSEAHEIIAHLPIRTLWTTNYDRLLEQAFNAAGKRLDVKAIARSIATSMPRRDAVLYKMHGDVGDPGSAVLTKEDYETYSLERQAFVTTLKADLLTKTFLFLGFSFTDPNLDYILARIRTLLGEHQREHYCLMCPPGDRPEAGEERAEWEYAKRKFDLRIADLKRYSIQTVLLDDYDEIPVVLKRLNKKVRTRSAFISGSAAEAGDFGESRLHLLVRRLGAELIANRVRVVSGLGLGVGGLVVLGAMEELYRPDRDDLGDTTDLLAIRPFPVGIEDTEEKNRIWRQHRKHLLAESGVAVFVSGNRLADSGEVEVATGVYQEFELALEGDVVPIPIGATGYVARELWQQVVSDPARYLGEGLRVEDELLTLGNPQADVEELVDAVLRIIARLAD